MPESPSSCSPRTFSNSARSTVMSCGSADRLALTSVGDFRAEIAHGFVLGFKVENGDGEDIRLAQRAGNPAGEQ